MIKYERFSCINFYRMQPKIRKIILLETREQLDAKPSFSEEKAEKYSIANFLTSH